ncbi:hypothetical protein FRC11_004196 [Ceratobasidium sp. 423]|nr:hypothetical protein FRC11_004196 [Ceratobasidium sp. 423]
MSSGTKAYVASSQPARFNAVIEAIAKTEKIIFLCGPETSVASGMPALTQTFSFSSNTFKSQMPLRTMIADCLAHDRDLFQHAEDQLAAYNKVMTARRIQARTASVNVFHQYFHRVFNEKHVVKYLTTSFDALEVSKKRIVESKVMRLHGDNRLLRCSTPGCPGVKEKESTSLDNSLLSGVTVTCSHCAQEAENLVTSRRPAPATSSYYLRPAVQSSLGIDMLPGGKLRNRVISAANKADLLLVVGLSLQSDEIMDLVREIAEQIHGRYGGVVYIGEQPIRGRSANYYVDFHLKMAFDECAQQVLSAMDRLRDGDASMGSTQDVDKSEIWFEIIGNELDSVVFRDEVDRPPIQEDIDRFACFLCWDQPEEGAYPFWPQAKHLRNHVAGKWASRGWPAHVEPVRLETLPEQGTVLPNLCVLSKTKPNKNDANIDMM